MKNLGPLEKDVLTIVWQQEHASVTTVLSALTKKKHHLAYTTVMTILARLVEKGVLRREKAGRLFIYKPVEQKHHFLRGLIHSMLATFVHRFGEEALTAFLEEADTLSQSDRQKYLKQLKRNVS